MIIERGHHERREDKCWKEMSIAEKVLLCLLLLALLIILVIFGLIVYLFLNAQHVCESPSCVRTSFNLLNTMDVSTNPCVDFYKFVCNNHRQTNHNCVNLNSLRRDDVLKVLTSDNDSESLMVEKQFFEACTEDDTDEENSNTTILSLISKIGGWPLLLGNNWSENNFHWLNFMIKLREWGFKYDWFISFNYHVDADGQNILLIGPPDLALVTDNNTYQEVMVTVSAMLGSSNEDAFEEVKNIVKFENKLASKIQAAQNGFSNINELTIEKLNTMWPEVKMVEIFRGLAKNFAFFHNTTSIMVDETYVYDLKLLLMGTSKRTQANYIIWKIVESFLPFCNNNFRQVYEKYRILGDRNEQCLSEAIRRFKGNIETYMNLNEKIEKIAESIQTMVTLIKQELGHDVHDTEVEIIGLQHDYNSYTLKSRNILRILNEINVLSENAFYNCLHKKSSICTPEHYDQHLEEIKMYFDNEQNKIYVPSVLLHSDFYELDQPNYINYAKLGRAFGDVFVEAFESRNGSLQFHGVDLAYQGYKKKVRTNGPERRLPAIKYSPEQIFWIVSSTAYCAAGNDSKKIEEVINSSYFIRDFNCEQCKFCMYENK